MTSADHSESLVLVRQLRSRADTRHQHATAARKGDEIRIMRGAYVPREVWNGMDARARHILRMIAYARTRRSRPTFSHWSAAAWHGLPIVGRLPEVLHVSVGRTSGGRSVGAAVAHSTAVSDVDIIESGELRLTSIARTIVDLAVTAPTPVAVAMADYVLRDDLGGRAAGRSACGPDTLRAAWERALPFRGHRRAREVIELADGKAGSPLESVSRVSMYSIGCPRPQLQVSFVDGDGFIGLVDFYWPEFGIVGEADGDMKYLDPAFRAGRTAEQVVLDEKIREDRLRALGLTVVRWRWRTANDANALRSKLVSAGLPSDGREAWGLCQSLE